MKETKESGQLTSEDQRQLDDCDAFEYIHKLSSIGSLKDGLAGYPPVEACSKINSFDHLVKK